MESTDFAGRAQTNIQLYRQMLAAGRRMDDVRTVRAAYALATQLFTCQFRPEGRPFLCHLVGVASLLAMLDAASTTIVAGLLHSAYSHGDFGNGRGRLTGRARMAVLGAVGAPGERLVAAYADQRWNAAAVDRLTAASTTLEDEQRQIILIRLADTIEDALDQGLEFSAKTANPNRDIPVEALVRLATAVGYPWLEAPLRALLLPEDRGPDLGELRGARRGSYVVGPSSWREKLLPRLARQWRINA